MMSTSSVEMVSTGGHHHHLQHDDHQHHHHDHLHHNLGEQHLLDGAPDDTTCYYFVCRLCALKCGQQLPSGSSSGGVLIFSEEGQLRQVRKKIHDCLRFVVHDGDKFPRTVCRDCLQRLDASYEFLVKCLESQQFLANLATHEVFDSIYEPMPKQNHQLQQQQQQQQQQQHLELSSTSAASAAIADGSGTASAVATVASLVIDANIEDSLPDTTTIAADLDQLVGGDANLHHHHHHQQHHHHHMLQYHHHHIDADDVSMAQHMEQLTGDLVGDAGVSRNDDDSLPDITLYSFDVIGTDNGDDVVGTDVAMVKATDEASFDLDDAAASFQVENNDGVDYTTVEVVGNDLYPDGVHEDAAENNNNNNIDLMPNDIDDVLNITPTVDVPESLDAFAASSTAVAAAVAAAAPTQSSASTKVCTVCSKSFATNYKLNVHMRTHTDDRPFRCSHAGCTKTFRSKCGLAQHGAQHTGQHQFACDVCGKGFQVRSYLTSHMKCHSAVKPFRCGECGEQFRARQTLLDHEARHLGAKAFACGRCEMRFISKALCVRHEKLAHGSSGADATTSGERKPELFGCSLCDKQFVRQSYLKTHMFSHTGERPFACDLCDRRMSTANDLKLHRRTHTDDAAYVCETCGKAFKRCDSLVIHRRSHTGERPYACTHCDQRFTQLTAMKLHQRLHTGERPYGCAVCPLWFESGSMLKQHMKKQHDGDETPKVGQTTSSTQI